MKEITPNENGGPFLFVSYSHKNSMQTLELIEALQEEGYRVWFDAGLEAGRRYNQIIANHIRDCAAMLCILSKDYFESDYCKDELTYARERRRKLVVPVYLDSYEEIMSTIPDDLDMLLAGIHALIPPDGFAVDWLMDEIRSTKSLECCKYQEADEKVSLTEAASAMAPSSEPKGGTLGDLAHSDTQNAAAEQPQAAQSLDLRLQLDFTDSSQMFVVLPAETTTLVQETFEPFLDLKNKALKKVIVPVGIKSLEKSCFANLKALEEVILPDGLDTIGERAFYKCEGLKEISLPNSLDAIGESAFAGCKSLVSVVLPPNLTVVADSTFSRAENLCMVTLGERIEKIGYDAFYNCKSLQFVNISCGTNEIDKSAFQYCDKLIIGIWKDSYGNKFARDNELPFVYVDPGLEVVRKEQERYYQTTGNVKTYLRRKMEESHPGTIRTYDNMRRGVHYAAENERDSAIVRVVVCALLLLTRYLLFRRTKFDLLFFIIFAVDAFMVVFTWVTWVIDENDLGRIVSIGLILSLIAEAVLYYVNRPVVKIVAFVTVGIMIALGIFESEQANRHYKKYLLLDTAYRKNIEPVEKVYRQELASQFKNLPEDAILLPTEIDEKLTPSARQNK